MSDLLYRKEILRLAADAHGAGRLVEPHQTGQAHNPACGDKVTVDLMLEGRAIAQIALDTKACVLAQASASILGRQLTGHSEEDVRELRHTIVAELRGSGPVPAAPFEAFKAFDQMHDYPARHRCVLLPIDAVLAAFAASDTA